MAANDAGGLSEVPPKDPPPPDSPRLGRTTGAADATQQALNNQEAIDADENRASGEEAATAETATAATTQIPREGDLAAILAAIIQINGRLGSMNARLEAVESQLATKVASTSVRNRFPSLKKKKEWAERIKDAIAKRRGRLEMSGKDDAETEKQTGNQDSRGTTLLTLTPRRTERRCSYAAPWRLLSMSRRRAGEGLAGSRPLLILCDFNAPHTTWGYKFQSERRKALAKAMEDHEMALLNEPDVTTRRGNSAARDTTPDLTWSLGTLDVTWRNEDVDLGSDLSAPNIGLYWSTARIPDWDNMTKFIQEQEAASEKESEQAERKQTYTEWVRVQKKSLQKFTQEIGTTSQAPYVDARLTNMWAARHSLTLRWKRQRHNRKLAKRIAVLNKQIAEHAAKLCRENWLKTCDGLQGKLSAR
ncbi:hypothetical protein HPB52_010736 [Rhipicephalus sanguineus]|uniref:Endonuclease/exonuclease/phosphatase domain-containing protein n=1 Tax=Rhipicephalus sanguineus TaxID=34632 RepID=A0A9D4YN98_RHISA|nr:hypothetical protein HPB52_010736 [Rhipicephalus sanguineus]